MNTPSRLRRNGRPANPNFAPDELLYFRFVLASYPAGQLLPAAFNLPIQSVNRGLYSNPQDVLLPNHQNAGIAAFPVQAIPMPKQHPQNAAQVYSLAVLHVPEQDNFSHSEIHGLLNGNADDSMPKSLRKAFRTDLFQQVNILQEPTA